MQHRPLSYDEWIKRDKPTLKGEVHLLLDGLQSIENAGLIFRTAEAMGVGKMYFYSPEFEWNDSTLKVISRSTSEQVDYEIIETEEQIGQLLSSHSHTVALEYTNRSESVYAKDFDFPLLLIAGNEHRGIRPEILREVQKAVHIPLFGQQSSINVACALTAALVEVNRVRRE